MAAKTAEALREVLLLAPDSRVTCPKCSHEFSLEAGFARRTLEAFEASSQEALASLQAQVRAAEEKRAEQRLAQNEALLRQELSNKDQLLEAQRKQSTEAIERVRQLEKEAAAESERLLREQLEVQRGKAEAAERAATALAEKERVLKAREAGLDELVERQANERAKAIADAHQAELAAQIEAQNARIAEFQTNELQLRKDRQALEEKQQQVELDMQRKLDEERRQIAEAARVAEAERAKLEKADLQKKLDDMHEQLEEMKRRADQGSQQAQGEVFELLLEERLAQAFPIDEISEVKKGVRGGDTVHTVMTRSGQAAGIVLWEAKRALRWSGNWPAKLKEDMREAGAVIGVIVTTSFPSDWPTGQLFGLYEGVWVTASAAAIPLAAVLREGLLEAHKARVASANKGEKMEAVYDYVTSPQFGQRFKAVGEVFKLQRKELDAERTAMLQRWKRREKQIELAIVQLANIGGELQGLAQQDLPQLELEPAQLEAPEAIEQPANEGAEA